jgi:hypothetical protein
MVFKVYVGSMSSELKDIRRIVIEQVEKLGMISLSVDDHQSADIVQHAKQYLMEADSFITLLSYKRGWEPPELNGKSLAEAEYDWAQEFGKAMAVLMPEPRTPLTMYLLQRALLQPPPERAAQDAFRKRVSDSGPVYWFKDEADLSAKIAMILKDWVSKTQAQTAVNLRPPTLERRQEFAASLAQSDIDVLAEKVAEKTAAKIQELQQRQQEDLAKQALQFNEALRLHPGELVFGRPSTSSQFKADIFMIMPFAEPYNLIYQECVLPTVADLKLTIKRGDDFASSRGSIMEEVWAAINACRIVIAEISVVNANVFYELGIAHTLNKPAVIMTQADEPEEVPFDVRHLRYFQYVDVPEGRAKLRQQLGNAVTLLLRDLEEGWGPGM